MGIDRLIDYSGYVQRNSVYGSRQDEVSGKDLRAQQEQVAQDLAEDRAKQAADEAPDAASLDISPRRANAPLSDIRIEMHEGERIDFGSIDVRKAISDMERDSLLHEYQYFVGNRRTGNVLVDDADGMVVRV